MPLIANVTLGNDFRARIRCLDMKLLAPRLSRHSWSELAARRRPGEPLWIREPLWVQGAAMGTGFCTEARLPLRLVPGLCPAPRAASAPPHRSKSAERVAGRLISCLGIVFLHGNHCPVLRSRIAGLAAWLGPWKNCPFFYTLRPQLPEGHQLQNQTHHPISFSL